MSMLFGESDTPQPQAVPVSPMASADAERKRLEAERAAIAESNAAGRRSTIVAGRTIAEEEQQERGMLARTRRAAARELG